VSGIINSRWRYAVLAAAVAANIWVCVGILQAIGPKWPGFAVVLVLLYCGVGALACRINRHGADERARNNA
jgi:hypothetical protein